MRTIFTNTTLRGLRVGFVVLTFLAAQVAGVLPLAGIAHAEGQSGAQQITLNPGGGIDEDGTDGMRFTINSDVNEGEDHEYNESYIAGQDAVVYRGTYQYCCDGGAPMLSIGGQLYGQAGPASDMDAPVWDSIEVVSTTGTTAVGARTASKGSASATLRYSIAHNGLTYSFDRKVAYTYPNDFVTDSYTFRIPNGNTEYVKFYLGGDTAPGSDDQGYGIMLTSPARSVISLNTESQIMFGFREAPGSRPFDGATSQDYYDPYETVQAGGDIGFFVEEADHDAGLMMQWNLGTAPGVQTASLQQFTTPQGTNMSASYSADTTNPNLPVKLSFSLVNTVLEEVDGLGFTAALPTGLKVAAGSVANSCAGSVTAAAGGTSVVLANGEVGPGTNCVVTVPVAAAATGTYELTASNISGLAGGLLNNVGASTLEVVPIQERTSDGNADGIHDSEQPYVSAITSSVTNKTVVLEVGSACRVDSNLVKAEAGNTVQDPGFDYPQGLLAFNVSCGTPGYTTTVKQYYYGVNKDASVGRKYNPTTNAYFAVPGATVTQTTLNGQVATVLSYQVTDGGPLDVDGAVNGVIVDPAGLGVSRVGAPNTGLSR